jgi:hypothetical protein
MGNYSGLSGGVSAKTNQVWLGPDTLPGILGEMSRVKPPHSKSPDGVEVKPAPRATALLAGLDPQPAPGTPWTLRRLRNRRRSWQHRLGPHREVPLEHLDLLFQGADAQEQRGPGPALRALE